MKVGREIEKWISFFNILLFHLSFFQHKMSDLCKALREKDQGKFFHWLECDEWKTIETMIEHHGIVDKKYYT